MKEDITPQKARHSGIAKSFFGLGALKCASLPLSLVTSILLARGLGAQEFGQYSFVLSLVTLLSLPISAGLPQLLTREIAAYVKDNNWPLYRGIVRASHIWVTTGSLLLLLTYGSASILLSETQLQDKWALLPLALFIIPLHGISAVRNGVMRGLRSPILASLPEMLVQPTLFIASLLFLAIANQLSAPTALKSQLASLLISAAFATWLLTRIQPKEIDDRNAHYEIGLWLRALWPFTLIYIVSTMNTNIAIVLLGTIGADTDVAAMRLAERMAVLIAVPMQLANIIIAPHIVDAWKSKDRVQLQRLSRQFARWTLIISTPIAAIFLISGEKVIAIAFGIEYADIARTPLQILSIAQIVNVAFGSVGILLSMCGLESHTLRGQLLALTASICVALTLIPMFGAVGAAIGTSCGIVVWNSLLAISVRRHIGIRPSVF